MRNVSRVWNLTDISKYVPEDGGLSLIPIEEWELELPVPPTGYTWSSSSNKYFNYLADHTGAVKFWLVKLARKPFGYVSGVFGNPPRYQARSLDPVAALTVTMAKARMTAG